MVPSFEKRVRAFAIDTSGMIIAIIISVALPNYWNYGVVVFAFLFIYIIPYIISPGQTFGKRNQKIKIVKMDGTDANRVVVILRELVKMSLSLLTFGVYMIVAFFALTEKHHSRTIHDYFFGTKMIDLSGVNYKQKGPSVLDKTDSIKKRGL